MTAEDVQNDLERMDHGDKEIFTQFEMLRKEVLSKGLPYVEPVKSKSLGYVKYLIKEFPDGHVEITDIDTGKIFIYDEPASEMRAQRQAQKQQITRWIRGNSS